MPRIPGDSGGASVPSDYNPFPRRTQPPSGVNSNNPTSADAAARNAKAAADLAAAGGGSGTTTTVGGRPISRNDRIHTQGLPLNLHGGGYYKPGYLRRVSTDNASYDYRFYFHYNPFVLTTSMSANDERTPSAKEVTINPFDGTQTMTFNLLLNRQMEQRDGSPALKLEGTMHDVEALYKVLNGDPRDLYAGTDGTDVSKYTIAETSSDYGYIGFNVVEFHFGPKLKYLGSVMELSVEHKMFNTLMVPILSEVSLTFRRLTGVMDPSTTTSDWS